MIPAEMLDAAIVANVRAALAEDMGDGDITAGLIPADAMARARVITREPMVLAGSPWADAVFAMTDNRIHPTGWPKRARPWQPTPPCSCSKAPPAAC